MLTFNLHAIFEARGIKNPFSYLIKAGFANHTAHNILNNKTQSIKLSHIESICILLNCTPNDLILFTPKPKQTLDNNHPLNQLKKKDKNYNWHETIKNIPLTELDVIVNNINQISKEKKKE